MWASPSQTDEITYEKMTAFAQEHFTLDNLNIVSTGIDVEKLDVLAENWRPISGEKKTAPESAYKGGE